MKLKALSVRMYDVGWGDCFLVRCEYSDRKCRHVLIDFGTTAASAEEERDRLMPVAEDIRERCSGRLDAVVATHRHRDHIGGFAERKRMAAPGNVIASLRPELVIQPWTENPRLPHSRGAGASHVKALAKMERFSHSLGSLVEAFGGEFDDRQREMLLAMAHQNYPNRHAVESLQRLGRRRVYARTGSRTGLEALLPGFSVRVLGPARPGAAMWPDLLRDPSHETWQKHFLLDRFSLEGERRTPLFPDAPKWHPAMAPPGLRWFIERVNRLRADQMVSLAKAAHSEINNTSLVLLIEGFGHKLLFPGDTEVRGWASILHQPPVREALRSVTLYKASHHGAGNGTPRSVWPLIGTPGELRTLVSRSAAAFENDQRFLQAMASTTQLTDTADLRVEKRPFVDIHLEPGQPAAKLVA